MEAAAKKLREEKARKAAVLRSVEERAKNHLAEVEKQERRVADEKRKYLARLIEADLQSAERMLCERIAFHLKYGTSLQKMGPMASAAQFGGVHPLRYVSSLKAEEVVEKASQLLKMEDAYFVRWYLTLNDLTEEQAV